MSGPNASPGTTFDLWVTRIETGILGLLLAAMLVLASTQIVLRNLFDAGIGWADPLIRALVLWIGLLGAVVAARHHKHIRIDVLTRFLGPRLTLLSNAVGNLFTALVAGLVAWHGGRMVLMEYEFETIAFSDVPAWVLQLVIPGAFGSIALIYGIGVILEILAMIKGRSR